MSEANTTTSVSTRLKPWQRFHNKLSLVYGGAMTLVVVSLSLVVVDLGVGAATESAASRALATANAVTQTLASESLARNPRDLANLANVLVSSDASIRGIYGLQPTENQQAYEITFSSGPEAPAMGTLYRAPHDTALRHAVEGPVAHESATEGETGATLRRRVRRRRSRGGR